MLRVDSLMNVSLDYPPIRRCVICTPHERRSFSLVRLMANRHLTFEWRAIKYAYALNTHDAVVTYIFEADLCDEKKSQERESQMLII